MSHAVPKLATKKKGVCELATMIRCASLAVPQTYNEVPSACDTETPDQWETRRLLSLLFIVRKRKDVADADNEVRHLIDYNSPMTARGGACACQI